MKLLASGLMVLCCIQVIAADDKKSDKEKLQGTWKIVSAVCNKGEEKDMKRTIGRTMTFAGDKLSQGKKGDEDFGEGTFKLDDTKKPKQIDMVHAKEGTLEGIYSVEGDELRLSFLEPKAKKRPGDLSLAKEGEKQFLFVLQRVKNTDK